MIIALPMARYILSLVCPIGRHLFIEHELRATLSVAVRFRCYVRSSRALYRYGIAVLVGIGGLGN